MIWRRPGAGVLSSPLFIGIEATDWKPRERERERGRERQRERARERGREREREREWHIGDIDTWCDLHVGIALGGYVAKVAYLVKVCIILLPNSPQYNMLTGKCCILCGGGEEL
eukprot:sb/3476852/